MLNFQLVAILAILKVIYGYRYQWQQLLVVHGALLAHLHTYVQTVMHKIILKGSAEDEGTLVHHCPLLT